MDTKYFIILGDTESFSQYFPPTDSKRPRQIGFGTVLYTLNTPPEPLRIQVIAALDKAEKTGYPVLIHMDDWNYPAPSADPEIVEWSDWPSSGSKTGPIAKSRWINWGTWFMVEAPRNFESPKVRSDIKMRLTKWILPPIVDRLKRWRKEGREYLFAGVVTGWETGFYDATVAGLDDPASWPQDGKVKFGAEDLIETGYAALTARGYNAAKIEKLAIKRGITPKQVRREILTDVVHDFCEFWTNLCLKAGLPKQRIYTHLTGAITTPNIPKVLADNGCVLPLATAVNRFCRPGVTVMDGVCDIKVIGDEFRKMRQPEWGAVEMEFGNNSRTEKGANEHLDSLTRNGAVMMCVYGWWEPEGHQFSARTPGVIAAIKRWLSGSG